MRARLETLHPNVILAPAAAVDLQAFAQATPRPLADGPVACYTGSFDRRLDTDLMLAVARRLPGWTFVFAGPLRDRAGQQLIELPNVRALGKLPLADVPGVIAGADVCLMPYRADAWGDTIFPLKLIEYLAAGKPVVSTPIQAAREFADVTALASKPQAFAAAVEAEAAADSDETRRRRQARPDGAGGRSCRARAVELIVPAWGRGRARR